MERRYLKMRKNQFLKVIKSFHKIERYRIERYKSSKKYKKKDVKIKRKIKELFFKNRLL